MILRLHSLIQVERLIWYLGDEIMNMVSNSLKTLLGILIVVVLGVVTEFFYNNILVISVILGLIIGVVTRGIKYSIISSVVGVFIWHIIIYLYFQSIPASTEILSIVSMVVGFSPYLLYLIPLALSLAITLMSSISISLLFTH